MRGTLILIFTFSMAAFGKAPIPDMSKIPQLSKKLPAGTIAWALINQLHPTQPQTGHREVRRKAKIYRDLLEKADGNFPQELYEKMYLKSIVPVYSGPIKRTDSRYGKEEMLGYNTDRTHTSFALANAIVKMYGREALSKPIFDKEGRPLNFVLVRVEKNKTDMTYSDFAKFMTANGPKRHSYLKFWSKTKDGKTEIRSIGFNQIPEEDYETLDVPFRSLVSWLQRKKFIGRAKSDYSQFTDAEQIAKYSGIKWEDIDDLASKKDLKEAREKAIQFVQSGSPEALSMPGVKILNNPLKKCDALLSRGEE